MPIYKRGKNWYIDYYLPGGKRIRQVVGTSKVLAEAALAKVKVELAEDRFLDKNRKQKIFFEEAAEKFLQQSKSSRDFTSFKHFIPFFKNMYVYEITSLDIDRYKYFRARHVKETTVNRELNCLKSFFSKIIVWGFVKSNPVKDIPSFPEKKFERMRYLNENEIKNLISECSPPHLRIAVIIALNTGMRRGEILNLRWPDVDLKNRYIHVEKTKTLSRRDIYINDYLLKELSEWKSSPHTGKNHVFKIRALQHSFASAKKRAGITDFRFHDLRHTFASYLVMKGVDLATVSKLLGHSSITMTMRYTHISSEHKNSAIEKIGEKLREIQESD